LNEKSNIIKLHLKLKDIYSSKYKFNSRELRVWQAMFHVTGCTNIILWSHEESKKKWSPAQVMKIIKKQNLDMLNPTFIAHTKNNKLWSMLINISQDIVKVEMNLEL
ncbi:8754_t:CDS:2, partial [Scutellospora calospora]